VGFFALPDLFMSAEVGMTGPAAARRRATFIGAIAPLLWATLALLTTYAQPLPAFELVALTFALAFLLTLGKWILETWRGGPSVASRFVLPRRAWVTGAGALFLYHVFYFNALARAPAVEASLICYLWPLLIVLFSAFLPGERLKAAHVLGALCGLAGAGLLVTKGQSLGFDPAYGLGYLAALACALTWSIYSLVNRRLGAVPSDAVGVYCGATALLGLACHLLLESWVAPSPSNLAAILALGLGPVGAAFFVWDYGVKRGDIQALGSLAYGSPLLSTLFLILAGRTAPSWLLAAAALLIVGGAALAAGGLFAKRSR
jgi:drug/metabolite transporter (DMT)-like permease